MIKTDCFYQRDSTVGSTWRRTSSPSGVGR